MTLARENKSEGAPVSIPGDYRTASHIPVARNDPAAAGRLVTHSGANPRKGWLHLPGGGRIPPRTKTTNAERAIHLTPTS